jgi:predicted component of type VI protein secretion system
MPVTHIKEIVAGLMTMALALPLASTQSAYTQPDNTSVLGLTVTGSPDLNAGMTVAVPVSGTDKPSIKPHRHEQLHQKQTRS